MTALRFGQVLPVYTVNHGWRIFHSAGTEITSSLIRKERVNSGTSHLPVRQIKEEFGNGWKRWGKGVKGRGPLGFWLGEGVV